MKENTVILELYHYDRLRGAYEALERIDTGDVACISSGSFSDFYYYYKESEALDKLGAELEELKRDLRSYKEMCETHYNAKIEKVKEISEIKKKSIWQLIKWKYKNNHDNN